MERQVKKLDQHSVLLFTGGARGITAQCAIELAKVVPCTYVLMGRSQQVEEPAWAKGMTDPGEIKNAIVANLKVQGEKPLPPVIESEYRRIVSSREIDETLAEIAQTGAKAVYLSADVTDAVQVRSVIAAYEHASGRKITGLVHGAGRLADRRIERKIAADFKAVYDTKVGGLQHVMDALDPDSLELLVLFSSVAGTFGNIGQADYAMANEVLNKTAWRFQKSHPNCRVLSINWGPWDSGMVNESLKAAFAERGIVLISMETGSRQFVDLVLNGGSPEPQIVVGSAIRRTATPGSLNFGVPIPVRRTIHPGRNPFLLDHQIGENRVLPATCAAAWMADVCQAIFPGYHFHRLEHYRVMKGLVFPDDTPTEYIVEVTPEACGESEMDIQCQVRIISAMGERPLLHYQAEIVLCNAEAYRERPVEPFWNPAIAAGNQPAAHYYTEKVLFHGPAFRGLKTIFHRDAESLGSISRLSTVHANTQGQFPVLATNPYMNDVILQGLLVWTYEMDGAVCLPSGIRKLEQYAVLPFDTDCYVQARVTRHTASSIRADAVVTDAEGRVYLRVEGVEGTISKALLPLFQSSHTSLDGNRIQKSNTERITAQG